MAANDGGRIAAYTIIIMLALLGVVAASFWSPPGRVLWALVFVLMLTMIVFVSLAITGLWFGALIDDRNRLSLARLQLYVSALGALFSRREPANSKWIDKFPPLDIGFVTMLGISNAGFLASKAIPRP